MAKQHITVDVRAGLWRAYERRCFFCKARVEFADLEIDHLLPESLANDQLLRELLCRLGLPLDFDLCCLRNLVPTHAHCNRRKSDLQFSDSSLRFYLELTARRLTRTEKEIQRLKAQTASDNVLISLVRQMETGVLSIEEVLNLVSSLPLEQRPPEPLVIGVCANVIDLQNGGQLPVDAPSDYVHLCDWLERDLVVKLSSNAPASIVACECSTRNGETLATRFASWIFDVDSLAERLGDWWTITEFSPFSEIYQYPPDRPFLDALARVRK